MKYIYLFLFHICLFTQLFSQEDKRLALVIGNANYDKGALKNPVNDALLMDSTLRVLGFDVILDTNIGTKTKFLEKVLEFGKLRSQYDLGLIYYAGHGVQINGYNYLLPTKEKYDSEFHVKEMGGVSVQSIMEFLQTKSSNKISILILDACRDNPFENNWLATRSIKGKGLAKMQAPAGSLIAFSTTSGNTAPDGEGRNSLYCQKLTKNMLTEGITLPEVFQNTRSEVLEESQKLRYEQLTEETTKLTSGKFYFRKKSYKVQKKIIDSLTRDFFDEDKKKYLRALEILSSILSEDSKNKYALYKKGEVLAEMGYYKKALDNYNYSVSLYPYCSECYRKRGYYYAFYLDSANYKKAINDLNKSIQLDSNNCKSYSNLGDIYFVLKDYEKALYNYNISVEIEPLNPVWLEDRIDIYILQNNYKDALNDLNKTIELYPESSYYFNNRADFYWDYLEEYDLALKDYAKVIDLNNDSYQTARAINNRAIIYINQGEDKLAIEEYSKAIIIEPTEPLCYSNRARRWQHLGDYTKALNDFTKSIELETDNTEWYVYRAECYQEMGDLTSALKDYDKMIDLNPSSSFNYNNRADFYWDYLDEYDLALKDYAKAIDLNSDDLEVARAINNRAIIYSTKGEDKLAIEEYTKSIIIEPYEPLYYSNRGRRWQNLGNYTKALNDFRKSIELETDNPEWYIYSADCYTEMENFKLALRDISSAIKKDKNDPYYWYLRADFYENKLNDKKNALTDLNKAVDLDSKNYLIERAKFYYRQKEFKNAERDYNLLVDLNKINSESYNERGLFYGLIGEYEKAHKDFKKSITIDTSSTSVYYYRHKIYEKQDLIEKQKADLLKTIKMDPNDPEGYYYLAILYENQERYYKVISNFNDAIRCLEENSNYYVSDDNGEKIPNFKIYLKVAETFKKIDEPEDMCEYYEKALNADDSFIEEKKSIEKLIKENCK